MAQEPRPMDQERLAPSGMLAGILPIEPASPSIWRRRGLLLLGATPIELLFLLFASRAVSHWHTIALPWLLTLDEGLAAILLLQAAIGLALWRQRWQYWLLLAGLLLLLIWLAGWPSPLALSLEGR
ncbi:MAG: hypothetical protein IRZ03_16200 [Acidobacterium ailaaui]|nr:hypothetical protein [Pseudacidobacterium ailaaui]